MTSETETHRKGALDPWGPWREGVTRRLESCNDYLSRLTRSLAGQIAGDRFYFVDKLHCLREAVVMLVAHCDDVEHWIAAGPECEEPIECVIGEHVWRARCALPAGHEGPHDDAPPPAPGERAYSNARTLEERVQRIADRLAVLPWVGDPSGTDAVEVLDFAADEIRHVRTLAEELQRTVGDLRRKAGARRS